VKLRFVSPWLLITFGGAASTLASVCINLAMGRNYMPSLLSHKVLAGMGCLLLWTGGLRYLEYYQTLYELVPTINTAVQRLVPFLAGFLPIFLGYAVMGLSAFGQTVPAFSTVVGVRGMRCVTLPDLFHSEACADRCPRSTYSRAGESS
jgi:hypothetical protein